MSINYFAIFLSLLINLIKRYSTKLSNFAASNLFSFNANEINDYKSELTKLYREREAYNPIDEFAKYALCDRKINKLLDKLRENKSELSTHRMKKIMYMNGVLMFLIALMSIVLIWTNYNHPIIDFNSLLKAEKEESRLSVFFPLNRFLSFPNLHLRDSIGVTAWLFILNRFLDIFINKFGSLFGTKKEVELKNE